jgi:glutaredoxin 2
MTYNDDETWENLSKLTTQTVTDTIYNLNNCHEAYQKWLSFKAGRTNAEVATALSKTETQIANMDACLQALGELWYAANNVSIDQGNRMASFRLFS